MSAQSQLTIAQSVFEGLFVRVLKPEGAFREELRRAGYDLDRQEPAYPLGVWDAALKIAVRHVYPGELPERALARLGERFLDGYFETIIGRFVSTALPLFGPDGVMKRLPRFWGSGAPGTNVEAIREAPGLWRLEIRHPSPQADFDTGMIKAGLKRTGVEAKVEMVDRSPTGYTARIEWSEPP